MKICDDCDRRGDGDECSDCGGEMRDPVLECRRCHDCADLPHHWMETCIDGAPWEHSPEPMPAWACKHCDFFMPYDGEDPGRQYEVHVESMRLAADEKIADANAALTKQRELHEIHAGLTKRAGERNAEADRLLARAREVMTEAKSYEGLARRLLDDAVEIVERARQLTAAS